MAEVKTNPEYIFDLDNCLKNSMVQFYFDLERWIHDSNRRYSSRFNENVAFLVSPAVEQDDLLKNLYLQYGRSVQTLGKISIHVNMHILSMDLAKLAIEELKE